MATYYEFQFKHNSIEEYDLLVGFENALSGLLPKECSVDGHEFGCGIMSLFIINQSKRDHSPTILDLIEKHFALVCTKSVIREMSSIQLIWKAGDVLRASLLNGKSVFGRVLAIEHNFGPIVIVYDSIDFESSELTKLIELPIIVRATIMHPEVAAKGEWRVVGNLQLLPVEAALANDAPQNISGENRQLVAANFFYHLMEEELYDIDDYINSDNHPIPATLYFNQHPFPDEIEQLIKARKDDEYFLDEIWMDALDWADGRKLDEARKILHKNS